MSYFSILSFLFCLFCSIGHAEELQRALIQPHHIKRAVKLSESYSNTDDWFAIELGKRPVLIVAPHAAPVLRKKKCYSDQGTGPLAMLLHELADVTVIYTTSSPPCNPNNDDDNPFKNAIRELIYWEKIELVIDLHTAHSYRPFDIDYGTLNGKSIDQETVEKLTACLKNEGLRNFSSNYFAAEKKQTVTKWANRHGAKAVQLEINATWLDIEGSKLSKHRFAQLLQGLVRFLLPFPTE